jgi:hypothetical protein
LEQYLVFPSCEEALEEISFGVCIQNDTAENLRIFLSVDGEMSEEVITVNSGSRMELIGYVADVEYTFEAKRQDDLVVVDSLVVNQTEIKDVNWRIAP